MFAAIHIPDFTAEAILRTRPELRSHAVAVIEGTPPLAYVVATNDIARRLGLHIGLTRMQAEVFQASLQKKTAAPAKEAKSRRKSDVPEDPRFKLVRDPAHMHNAQFTESLWPSEEEAQQAKRQRKAIESGTPIALCVRSEAQERAAHAALLDAAHAFSPNVEDTMPDTVLLDLAGLERLFGPVQKMARELARRVSDLGLEANVAAAANPYTAMHAAHGFAGVTVIEPGTEADRIASLKTEVLFATPLDSGSERELAESAKRAARILDTLDRWGVRNFRGLAALPPVSLSERLGRDGVRLQKLARGLATRDLRLATPTLSFEEALELEYPVETVEPLAFLLGRILEQLCARMSARALATNEIKLRMQMEFRAGDETTATQDDFAAAANVIERRLTLPVAMNDARLFLKLLQLELNANPPGGPVCKIWLSAEPARPRVAQAGLFVPLVPEPEKLELTLARIHKVLRGVPDGDAAPAPNLKELRAGSPEVLDTHRPDAFRVVRFTPKAPEESGKSTVSVNDESAKAQTALRRFRPPLAAEVAMCEGRPAGLVCEAIGARDSQSARRNIVWAAGPWRTSGDWWVSPEHPEVSAARKPAAQEAHEQRPPAWQHDQWDVAVSITTTASRTGLSAGTLAQVEFDTGRRQTNVALYRIFCDVTNGTWFVEGSYD